MTVPDARLDRAMGETAPAGLPTVSGAEFKLRGEGGK